MRILLGLLVASMAAASLVNDLSFEKLESEPGQKVVLFCNGADCAELSAVMDEVGATPDFDYVRIDCATDANLEKCAQAGFDKTPPRFFTNTVEAGIEPYSGENTAAALGEYLTFRTQPVHDSNVVYFESKEALEALVEKGAVLAKFHQTWCGHCKTMKKHFEKASASFPKDGPIHLVDVDCGQHAEFCSTHNINGYPTVKLLTAHTLKTFLQALPVAGGAKLEL